MSTPITWSFPGTISLVALAVALYATPAATPGELLFFEDPVVDPEDYHHVTNLTIHSDPSDQYGLEVRGGERHLRWSTSRSGDHSGTIHYIQGFDEGRFLIVPGRYTASVHVGRGALTPPRHTFTTFEFQLTTVVGVEIGEKEILQDYVPPAEGEWTTVTVGYNVGADSPVIGEALTWQAEFFFEDRRAGHFFGAVDLVSGQVETHPLFVLVRNDPDTVERIFRSFYGSVRFVSRNLFH